MEAHFTFRYLLRTNYLKFLRLKTQMLLLMQFFTSDIILIFLSGLVIGIIVSYSFFVFKRRSSWQNVNIYDKNVQLEILLNTLPDFIYIKDTESRFVAVNKKHLQIFNFDSFNKVLGKKDSDFYPAELAVKFENDEKKIISTGIPLVGIVERGLNEKGEQIFISTSKYPIYNKKNKIIGLVGIGRDITNLKEYEIELTNKNQELKLINEKLHAKKEYINEQTEQLRTQAGELEFANEQLTELIKTRDKFFSIIAHDLKNPVNLLRGFSELLLYRFKELPDDRRIKYIETINKNTLHLSDLLDKLLQWARMQTGGIRFEPEVINIQAFIEENLSPLTELFEQKCIKINTKFIRQDLMMLGDRNMLDFVIRNLVTNAVKYTMKGGEIMVSCNTKGEFAEFCILDNGVGIEENMRDQLFSLARNKTREGTDGEMGTGLGLFLCKDFIERNRGKIWCVSNVNEGASFYFNVPLISHSN